MAAEMVLYVIMSFEIGFADVTMILLKSLHLDLIDKGTRSLSAVRALARFVGLERMLFCTF